MTGNVDFATVREIGLALPGVRDGTTRRGFALKLRGKLLACKAIHRSAEANSLMVRVGFDDRARLLAASPDVYYVTEHYSSYPAVLARLSVIDPGALRELLATACQFVSGQGAN